MESRFFEALMFLTELFSILKCNLGKYEALVQQLATSQAYKFCLIERFLIECLKTKVITLTKHNSRKQSREPIRTRSKYMYPADYPAPSVGKTRAGRSRLVLVLLLIS